jgi:hypothetical protein
MKLPKFSFSPELIYRIHYPKSPKNILIAVGALLLLTGVIFAATPLPTGTIAVYTYDVSSGSKQRLGNVQVKVNSVNSPYECPTQTKTTEPASSGSSEGYVAFQKCPAGTYSNRKYLKYTLVSVSRSGYQLAPNSPFKVGADKSSSKGGSFAVRKKRVTRIRIYLTKGGKASSPSPSGSSVAINKGNIIYAPTHHGFDYALAQPDDAWISHNPNFYYLGSVYPGWSVDLVRLNSPSAESKYGTESNAGYMFGMISRPDGSFVQCGWLEPNTVSKDTLQAHTNICSNHPFLKVLDTNEKTNTIRKTFGQQYNCSKGDVYTGGVASGTEDKCNSPITLDPIDMNPNCTDPTLYRDYFSNGRYNTGSFSKPLGKVDLTKGDSLRYRFTTLDGKAAVVAGAHTWGWGFIDRSCIVGWPTNKNYWEVRHPDLNPYGI